MLDTLNPCVPWPGYVPGTLRWCLRPWCVKKKTCLTCRAHLGRQAYGIVLSVSYPWPLGERGEITYPWLPGENIAPQLADGDLLLLCMATSIKSVRYLFWPRADPGRWVGAEVEECGPGVFSPDSLRQAAVLGLHTAEVWMMLFVYPP